MKKLFSFLYIVVFVATIYFQQTNTKSDTVLFADDIPIVIYPPNHLQFPTLTPHVFAHDYKYVSNSITV